MPWAVILRAAAPYLIMGTLAGGGYIWLSTHYYNKGYHAAIEKIAEQDQEAVDAAKEARDRHRACVTAGGVWDTASGKCNKG